MRYGFFILLLLLTGCSDGAQAQLEAQGDLILQILQQEDWPRVQAESETLKQLYEEQEWKIQLLGDEGEYEGLQESLEHLLVAVAEQDRMETRRELATIESYLQLIFSL